MFRSSQVKAWAINPEPTMCLLWIVKGTGLRNISLSSCVCVCVWVKLKPQSKQNDPWMPQLEKKRKATLLLISHKPQLQKDLLIFQGTPLLKRHLEKCHSVASLKDVCVMSNWFSAQRDELGIIKRKSQHYSSFISFSIVVLC